MAVLKSAMGYIRRELAASVNLRNTPELIFVMDQSIEYGVNMSKKISDVISEDEAHEAMRVEEGLEAPHAAEAETDGDANE